MTDRVITDLNVTNKAKAATFGQFFDGNQTVGQTINNKTSHLSLPKTKDLATLGSETYGPNQFLKSKFKVGSCKSDKITFRQGEKVFHSSDIPEYVGVQKKIVLKSKNTNILGTSKDPWNYSTAAQPRLAKTQEGYQYGGGSSLKRTLQKVRAGLMDQRTLKDSKYLSEEQLADRIRYIVGITGKGPIGKFVGRWWNALDERGLPAHCVNPDWPDWDASTACYPPEDVKQSQAVFQKKEERRLRMNVVDEMVNFDVYESLLEQYYLKNKDIEDRKVEYQDLKDLFKHELRVEFPNACEERLQSMAQRLLEEKLLSDVKLKRFPVQHESFKPNLSLTTQDRRYKQFHHPGAWSMNEREGRFCWSCCLNYREDSKGCAVKVINPDRWCLDGFERAGLH